MICGTLAITLLLASVVYGSVDSETVTVTADVSDYIAVSPVANVALGPIAGAGGSDEGSTTVTVATNNDETAGENTVLYFKADVGASKLMPSGAYQADLTVTATTL